MLASKQVLDDKVGLLLPAPTTNNHEPPSLHSLSSSSTTTLQPTSSRQHAAKYTKPSIMAAIKSTFVGNHAIIWEPMTPAPQQAPTNDQTERFDAFLKAELEKCKNKTGEYHGKSTLWRADRTKHMLALQAVLCDPSPSLAISGSTNDFDEPFVNNLAGIRTLMATWSNKPPEDIRREAAWTKATSKADKVVPSWYGMQCSITSIKIYDAAQIVDLQAFKGIGEESLTVWRHLRVFWPALDKIQTFDIFGKELENILPLSPTAYRLWQTNKLGLRPIPHPHDPKSIYLQVVWFQNYHNDIGWSKPVGPPTTKTCEIPGARWWIPPHSCPDASTSSTVMSTSSEPPARQPVPCRTSVFSNSGTRSRSSLPESRPQWRLLRNPLGEKRNPRMSPTRNPPGEKKNPRMSPTQNPLGEKKNLRMTPTQTPALVRGRGKALSASFRWVSRSCPKARSLQTRATCPATGTGCWTRLGCVGSSTRAARRGGGSVS